MMLTSILPTLLLSSSLLNVAHGAVAHVRRDGSDPALPFDPNSSTYCTWWVDYTTAQTCSSLLSDNGITLEAFRRWNPTITADCGNLITGRSYCVEAIGEPAPGLTTTSAPITTSKTSTSSTSPTTTKVPNGIETPSPTQATIVDNCDKFYLVKSGEGCTDIAAANGITPAQFLEWNPSTGAQCTGLWSDAYACVSIIGHEPTPTKPDNGVTTPVPTQAGMVDNCARFHFIASGQSCQAIIDLYGITLAQFTTWNSAANADCTGLWAETYACVGLIGGTTATVTTAPTTTANGIATPTPTQPSMVNNCDSFYFTVSGDNCDSIVAKSGITAAQFLAWNPSVGSTCTGIWLNAYVCISIIGHTPTPVSPSNGVTTPTPIQDGMTTNCKTFHFVASGETCASILTQFGLTQAQFTSWNPAVGATCTGLWSLTYACVAVL